MTAVVTSRNPSYLQVPYCTSYIWVTEAVASQAWAASLEAGSVPAKRKYFLPVFGNFVFPPLLPWWNDGMCQWT